MMFEDAAVALASTASLLAFCAMAGIAASHSFFTFVELLAMTFITISTCTRCDARQIRSESDTITETGGHRQTQGSAGGLDLDRLTN